MTTEEQAALEALGKALRANRKRRGDNQADAADRCGVSRETYRLMEQGKPGTGFGYWIRAIRLYGDLGLLEALFPTSLFDQLSGR
ncbi:MAG: helix-turn-helix domain-containing protein [Candidatus Thiodiazotropha sp. (ex Dulcina madagascariensis)]|nr:helix-turn-helix domain-containing protein [Candidatus Thiodiazotropha sp. (ex Dulcina madagascariensis)]MCU7929049.1 helix-turn-helix domain-containing protein [Candidatus Thiodiazotropha sp. (ex Dulcina madagascariensis)]MCU7934641.1 helix-turn-helix domain-containing protein [Candidatus Thiodiazotropha sp. (ex Dulcina madagascariensis)]